jgi:hypothetical protein
MPHLDDDLLALLALGEVQPDAETAAHLDTCAHCRHELHELSRVVTAGRTSVDATHELVPPAGHVWAGVAAAVGKPASDARPQQVTDPPGAVEEPRRLRPRGERRTLHTWLAVAAGVAVGMSATVAFQALDPDESAAPEDDVVATASLAKLGADGTSGTAEIRDTTDARVLRVELDDRATGRGFREVWLLDPATGQLVSLGVLNGTEATFELPAGLDLRDYPTVDVSREPLDGDPAHSADSIARGDLDL